MPTAILRALCAILTCCLVACGGSTADATDPDPSSTNADASGSGETQPSTDATDAEPETDPVPDPDADQDPAEDPSTATDPGAEESTTPDPDPAAETSGDSGTADADAADENAETTQEPSAEPDFAMPQPVGDPAIDRLVAFIQAAKIDRAKPKWRESLPAPPEDVPFEPGRAYYWKLTTSEGDVTVRLRPATAPRHVANAIYLTLVGYYDGLKFHRIIDGFMAQGGCPRGDGTGDPGYSLDGEFADGVNHDARGQLSAANSGPGTDGSQFFLTFGPAPHLDGKHTIYGAVVDGRETLLKLEAAGTPSGKPSEEVVLEAASVEAK